MPPPLPPALLPLIVELVMVSVAVIEDAASVDAANEPPVIVSSDRVSAPHRTTVKTRVTPLPLIVIAPAPSIVMSLVMAGQSRAQE